MNRNKLIELAKKIKKLAEKGKDGEKNAAKEKLERLCEKHNILDSEISTEEFKDYYIVINDQNERDLIINICCMILDVPAFKWKEKNNCVCINLTKTQYENINSAFEYYKEMYNDYKRYLIQGIISRNAIGYIPKPQTYTQENIQSDINTTPSPSEDVKNEKNKQFSEESNSKSSNEEKKSEDKSEDVKKESPIDPIKLMRIAVALDKKPWVKNDPNKKLIE